MTFWFGDMFAHGNGAGKQMLLDQLCSQEAGVYLVILSLLFQDLNVTGKTKRRCGFGHEGSRKESFFGMHFVQNTQ